MIKLGNIQKSSSASSFWLDPIYFRGSSQATDKERESADLLKMASVRRSIANFVKIVTGKNIPVKFKETGMSYTTGKEVVITSDLTKFDSVCGHALHEGSHILLSSFKLLEDLIERPGKVLPVKLRSDMAIKHVIPRDEIAKTYIVPKLKSILNWLEDRRIDNYIYTNAPGYQGYYNAMYEEYWNSEEITKGLKSELMREEEWRSYEFRIINLTNANRDLKALKGLEEIWKLADLKNISRFNNTQEVLDVAIKIFEEVEKYVPKYEEDETQEAESKDGEGEPSNSEETESRGSNPKQSNKENSPPDMSDREIEKMLDDLEKQIKFLDGDVNQKEINESNASMINALEEAGTEQKEVAKNTSFLTGGTTSCSVIVVKELTKKLITQNPFGLFYNETLNQSLVDDGFKLGRLLGKKLQIRNEERTLKTTRLRTGKIDDRLIHSLGFGAEQVFEKTFIDIFNPVHLHISIDASGSMSGSKWDKTLTSVVAIAVAGSMVSNLDVVISFRYTGSTQSNGYSGWNSHKPIVIVAYDSKRDNIIKVKQLFGYLHATGGTPESLCYEAIQSIMVSGTRKTESYFINFSDGEPYFHSHSVQYEDAPAIRHTKKMMDIFRGNGIKILSYFIGRSNNMDDFKQMYGRDATKIEVTSLIPLAKSLNKLFTTK